MENSLLYDEHTPTISIIIPVYSVEKYLSKCLDSIVAQTFTDWECILIDDGSTDASGKICDEYAQKDSRFNIVHQDNKGVSVARNTGLNIAKGEWISFIDSDDYIESQTYEELLQEINNNEIGIIQYGCIMENESGKVIKTRLFTQKQFTIPSQFDYFEPSNCYKLIRRKIINDNNICFREDITLSEDRLFAFECYLYSYANNYKCFYFQKSFYHYIQHSRSSTHNMSEINIQHEIQAINIMECKASELKICGNDYDNFIQEQKIITKNHCIFLIRKPNFYLWRSTFPEVNSFMLKDRKRNLLYRLIISKNDFLSQLLLFANKTVKMLQLK